MIKAIIFDCFGVLIGADGNGVNDELFAYIQNDLKPHYKIGLLSNIGSDILHELFTPEQIALLDEKVLSFEVGTVKPDPMIYETAATRLDALSEECLFIDDLERFCTAAEDVGMTAIWHTDTKQTIEKIKELTSA
jgi:putative hydrolase of the HAD superfamily